MIILHKTGLDSENKTSKQSENGSETVDNEAKSGISDADKDVIEFLQGAGFPVAGLIGSYYF